MIISSTLDILPAPQYVSVGVLYESENLLWVANKKIDATDSGSSYESEGAVSGLPDTLDKGKTAVITAEISTVHPFADISFSIFSCW